MLNSVVLMGRLTADPEQRMTSAGTEVVTFTIAVDRAFSKEKATDFINIVVWSKTASFVNRYFSKGDMIAIKGRIRTRSYETKDGRKRTATEVIAEEVSFCGSKQNDSTSQKDKFSNDSYEEIPDENNDTNESDLPF